MKRPLELPLYNRTGIESHFLIAEQFVDLGFWVGSESF